jgi:hypothetical protein
MGGKTVTSKQTSELRPGRSKLRGCVTTGVWLHAAVPSRHSALSAATRGWSAFDIS